MTMYLNQPSVTVITPVYNGAKHLAQCIESILAQTYRNWEYIIVNNCSTDGTLKIAQEYAAKDDRIRIHENEYFLGVVQNHNNAFSLIPGESKYCKILHADDWLFPDCIEKMVGVAEENPGVGIVGSYRLDDRWVNCDGLPYPSTVISGRDICRTTLLGGPYVFGSPSTILMRSDLIRARKSFYNEKNFHADREACFDIASECDFGFVHQVLSFTRRESEARTSFAWRVNTYILGNLMTLKKYGPVYLSDEEYEGLFKKSVRDYCRFLAASLFLRREKEFWEFHRKGLKELGLSFSAAEMLKAAFVVLYNKVLKELAIS